MSAPVTGIEALIGRYVALSEGMRFAEKRAFWDEEEPNPVLKPEEVGAPLVGWAAIDGYWRDTRSALASLKTDCWDFTLNPLSEDVVLALFKQRWVARMNGPVYLSAAPIASTVRVTMGLRRRDAGWKIFLAVESHVDGIEYFRNVFSRRAVTLA